MMARSNQSASVHGSHEADMQDVNEVHEQQATPWLRTATLEMPKPQAGMEQRWIHFQFRDGKSNATNYNTKLRQGWKPRRADTVPASFGMPSEEHSRYPGTFIIDGNILCERPAKLGARRKAHFEAETQKRTDGINAQLDRENSKNRHPGFGPIGMTSRAVVAKARAVTVADDE